MPLLGHTQFVQVMFTSFISCLRVTIILIHTTFHLLVSTLGQADIIEPLYRKGAVLNIETKFEKRTPLHVAASAGWTKVVHVLLDLKVDPDRTDIYGSTPLHAASLAG